MDNVDYKKLYFTLFNGLTDAIRALQKEETELAMHILMEAQRQSEEYYIESEA